MLVVFLTKWETRSNFSLVNKFFFRKKLKHCLFQGSMNPMEKKKTQLAGAILLNILSMEVCGSQSKHWTMWMQEWGWVWVKSSVACRGRPDSIPVALKYHRTSSGKIPALVPLRLLSFPVAGTKGHDVLWEEELVEIFLLKVKQWRDTQEKMHGKRES